MPNLSHSLITDLLSDDYQMLYHGDEPPRRISLFYDHEPNQDVREAIQRISDVMLAKLDPDDVYAEARRHMGWLGQGGIFFTPSILVLVLHYEGATQRVLELHLQGNKGTLHFLK